MCSITNQRLQFIQTALSLERSFLAVLLYFQRAAAIVLKFPQITIISNKNHGNSILSVENVSIVCIYIYTYN